MNFSFTNYRQQLLISNTDNDLLYGLSLGISLISSKNNNYDFGISSLGSGGYVYGITMKF